jgi:hypothetical protein
VSWVDIDNPDPDPIVQAELPNANSVSPSLVPGGPCLIH